MREDLQMLLHDDLRGIAAVAKLAINFHNILFVKEKFSPC